VGLSKERERKKKATTKQGIIAMLKALSTSLRWY